MNIRRIIKEELEANEFANLVELMKSKQVENIELALILAQNCQEQFKKEFGYSVEEYSKMFEQNLKKMMLSNNYNEIVRFLIKEPNLYYLFEIKESMFTLLLSYQPLLVDKFDLSLLNEHQIYMIMATQPQLIDKFDLSLLNGNYIVKLLIAHPQFIDRFDLTKLNESDIYFLLKNQPQLKPYFDKLKKK